MSHNYNIAA